jgi:putative transposase
MAATHQAVLIEAITALKQAGTGVTTGCRLLGIARATYYRIDRAYRHYLPVPDPIPHAERVQPAALTLAERNQVVAALTDERYADLSVTQLFWHATDEGRMPCSERTCYRIAAEEGLVGDRRRRRRAAMNAPRRRPVVQTDRPGQAWCWDVTDLPGRGGRKYKLYLVIDVFSRYPVAHRVEPAEDRHLAAEMFAKAFTRHGTPQVLHSDNGPIMRSRDLRQALHTAAVATSYSRPYISDDNPFSEALFKTLKYDLACPEVFDDIDHARTWTTEFLHRYATEHRHHGLARHTPASVFDGTAHHRHTHRQHQLDERYRAHPERFRQPPQAPELPTTVGINNKHLSQTG